MVCAGISCPNRHGIIDAVREFSFPRHMDDPRVSCSFYNLAVFSGFARHGTLVHRPSYLKPFLPSRLDSRLEDEPEPGPSCLRPTIDLSEEDQIIIPLANLLLEPEPRALMSDEDISN